VAPPDFSSALTAKSQQVSPPAPEVGYYYPEPFWRLNEVDRVKNLLLFFDRIAILLPRYMRGRETRADPVLAGPLRERGLLEVLEPETFVDIEMAQQLSDTVLALLERGAFDELPRAEYFAELSQSRMGWDADVKLAKNLIKELRRRKLAKASQDKLSVPLHPVVRQTILVTVSQLARSRGRRAGLNLQPVTTEASVIDALRSTLSLPTMPSVGHIVGLDLEAVGLDLSAVPLDDVLEFRQAHGIAYRDYARDLRKMVAILSPLPTEEREQLLRDRREELADRADVLRRSARRAWRHPMATIALGIAGAAWSLVRGDVLGSALALGDAADELQPQAHLAGAYSYLFQAQKSLSH
jgi:hypothetical protein